MLILHNDVLINNITAMLLMLLNMYLYDFAFPDIIFDNHLIFTLHIKLNSVEYLFRVIYHSQIIYQDM